MCIPGNALDMDFVMFARTDFSFSSLSSSFLC